MRTNKIITFTVAVLFSSLIFAQDTESTAATISKAKTKPPVISKYQKIIEERMKSMNERQAEEEKKKLERDKILENPELDPLLPANHEITEALWFFDERAEKILAKTQILPKNNPWNEDISGRPLDKNSDKMVQAMSQINHLEYNLDMAFVIVPPNQKRKELNFILYKQASEPGPYPIPNNITIEGWPLWPLWLTKMPAMAGLKQLQAGGGGDRHALVLDPDNMKLYEFYRMRGSVEEGWDADCVSIFDLTTNKTRLKYSGLIPDKMGLTSSDAAGLPIIPSVPRFDEFKKGAITHALRFTARKSRAEYVWPATHYASGNRSEILPRMGERFRLRSSFNTTRYAPQAAVILEALKKYGMIMADNGGDWRISIAPDPRWDIKQLNTLRQVNKSNFEVIIPSGPNEAGREGEKNLEVVKKRGTAYGKPKNDAEEEE